MGHQSYVLLCTETTLSNPPVVQPKSSCDVHLLRSPWLIYPLQSIKLLYRYLILEMKDESAGENALIQLRNTDNVTEELNAIKAESNSSDQSESLSVRQLLKLRFGQMKLALFVTICVHLSQQLSGMPAILYYSTKIFTVCFL